MENMAVMNIRRDYQAEVYLALGTILQAISLTALGVEVAGAVKHMSAPDLYWSLATGLLSLALCFTFWYIFVRDFFFGFRVITLNAANHFVLAAAIFTVGFLQFIAFQFLSDPRLWLTLVLLSIAVVFANSWYISHKVELIDQEEIRRAVLYDPNPLYFLVPLGIAAASLIGWYLIPGLDTGLFRSFVLLVTGTALIGLNINSIHIFQRHLETNSPGS
jgi:hypothetical protein